MPKKRTMPFHERAPMLKKRIESRTPMLSKCPNILLIQASCVPVFSPTSTLRAGGVECVKRSTPQPCPAHGCVHSHTHPHRAQASHPQFPPNTHTHTHTHTRTQSPRAASPPRQRRRPARRASSRSTPLFSRLLDQGPHYLRKQTPHSRRRSSSRCSSSRCSSCSMRCPHQVQAQVRCLHQVQVRRRRLCQASPHASPPPVAACYPGTPRPSHGPASWRRLALGPTKRRQPPRRRLCRQRSWRQRRQPRRQQLRRRKRCSSRHWRCRCGRADACLQLRGPVLRL